VNTALAALLAFGCDALLGEPRRWHPLVGFGRIAAALERRLNGDPKAVSAIHGRLRGAVGVLVLIAPPTLLIAWLGSVDGLGAIVAVLALYLALGLRSLKEHGEAVRAALAGGDLSRARESVGRMVSRDTADMDDEAVACAAVESVLENGNDAVFGALFWFAVAGAPGAVVYRLANTLDAMWGYRSERFQYFGWAAARLDDGLGYPPARLTALSYAVCGNARLALRCWRTQAGRWDSPNAGPVMAAGAGALGLRLGGPARYRGEWQQRPMLGGGDPPMPADISRALRLAYRSAGIWLALLAAWGLAGA
jgi:adenosylcobinamide-phosphate synthase